MIDEFIYIWIKGGNGPRSGEYYISNDPPNLSHRGSYNIRNAVRLPSDTAVKLTGRELNKGEIYSIKI